jgi:hypothetical protein
MSFDPNTTIPVVDVLTMTAWLMRDPAETTCVRAVVVPKIYRVFRITETFDAHVQVMCLRCLTSMVNSSLFAGVAKADILEAVREQRLFVLALNVDEKCPRCDPMRVMAGGNPFTSFPRHRSVKGQR